MAKGGFMSPFKTTLRSHLWRTSWVLGRRMLILRMTIWIVSSCSLVGGFNVLRKLAMEALCSPVCSVWTDGPDTLPWWYKRGPETGCLYHWPTWQRPSTEDCKRYWKNLEEDRPPYPQQIRTLVNSMGGRRLSCSSSGRDGCWEVIRITVVPWESLIFWRVLGTIGAGGKAYIRPKASH